MGGSPVTGRGYGGPTARRLVAVSSRRERRAAGALADHVVGGEHHVGKSGLDGADDLLHALPITRRVAAVMAHELRRRQLVEESNVALVVDALEELLRGDARA